MAGLAKLVPATLKGQGGAAVQTSSLAGKTVFFYFSASWCPPCRTFTPQLAAFYNKHKTAKNFEIVFVSWDEDAPKFDEYFTHHPWLALPFAEQAAQKALTAQFKVQGIPTLIGIDADSGDVVTKDARNHVVQDPEALEYPWKAVPESVDKLFGPAPLLSAGGTVNAASLLGKSVMIYFSASWCPPCRTFTPQLVTFYERNKAAKNIEIVFVSLDRDQAAFDEYRTHHPWLTAPFDQARARKLAQKYEVRGIPTLVVIDPATGDVICDAARDRVPEDPEAVGYPWAA